MIAVQAGYRVLRQAIIGIDVFEPIDFDGMHPENARPCSKDQAQQK
jgi:hypothetical protein